MALGARVLDLSAKRSIGTPSIPSKNSFLLLIPLVGLSSLYYHLEPPIVVCLDRITDPVNLGSIIRTATYYACALVLCDSLGRLWHHHRRVQHRHALSTSFIL